MERKRNKKKAKQSIITWIRTLWETLTITCRDFSDVIATPDLKRPWLKLSSKLEILLITQSYKYLAFQSLAGILCQTQLSVKLFHCVTLFLSLLKKKNREILPDGRLRTILHEKLKMHPNKTFTLSGTENRTVQNATE